MLLAQILRAYGPKIGAELCPTTDMASLVEGMKSMLPVSSGAVIQFDLATVTVDLSSVPIDEVLDYRKEHLVAHRRYRASVRVFAVGLTPFRRRSPDY